MRSIGKSWEITRNLEQDFCGDFEDVSMGLLGSDDVDSVLPLWRGYC